MAYDIGEAFQKIEEEMIASMSRNLKRHIETEKKEGLNYSMWQAEQLAALNNFRKDNKKQFSGYFSTINGKIAEVLQKANETGLMEQEINILEAIRDGLKIYNYDSAKSLRGQFFKLNERKMNALIKATQNDMAKAETAMLRMANDEYRKIIFNSEVFYNSGAGTLSQCVDMATKDFLSKGISCIEYANGARVGIDVYSRMALRTAQTRAYLAGEATKRDEWGINTVIVNRRGVACPRCLKWVGKVYYDDVYGSSPVPSPAKYPLLSEAIAGGLYHPNCKDIHTTYFEDVSSPPKPMTQKEIDEANRVYALEQRQRYNERQIRKYKRLVMGSTDPENIAKYTDRLKYWQTEQRDFIQANSDVLKRRSELEKIFDAPPNSQSISTLDENHDIINKDPCENGHTWLETITKQPKCEEAGEKRLTCSVCGEETTEIIPALGHDLRSTIYDPTCTAEGYTIKWCARCNYREKTDIKPALGHDWGDWIVTRQPTTALYGRKQAICKRCGEKRYTTIPKLKATSPAQQIKALQDSITKLDTDIAALNQSSYSGIWKDSVTVSDYPSKKSAIAAKKQYFIDKLNAGDTAKDWQQLIDLTDEFDLKGQEYERLLAERQKNQAALDLLQPSSPNDAFSPARKNAAKWFDKNSGGFSAADKYYDPPSKKVHASATAKEERGFYTYTQSSGGHNRPLAGFQKPYSRPGRGWEEEFYVGPKKVWIDFEGKGEEIRGLTTLIQKSTYPDDVWIQSGQDFQTIEGFLGINRDTLSKMNDSQLQQFVGRESVITNFISGAVNEGGGSMFNSKPLKLNIYAPKGSQMLYASDVGAFGKGENEMIFQRGGHYKITKIYWGKDATDGNRRKIFVDMEIHPEKGYDLFQQDPSEWKGSKKNYRNS